MTPQVIADHVVPLFETGWPHHVGTPWVNLDIQRFHRRVIRTLNDDSPRPQRPPRANAQPLRVGVLARLDDAFFFTRRFFEAAPAGVEVTAFDFGSDVPVAGEYLASAVERYDAFALNEISRAAKAMEAADLDLLLVDVRKSLVHSLFDRIGVACIAVLCAEVHLRYHPSVSFHLYPFQQADYLAREGRLWCATSRSFFGDERVYPAFFPYDRRGLDPTQRRSWSERDPLVVFHGRMFKASEPFVETILALLCEDDTLEFVLMGLDSHGALARIEAQAARHGVSSRIHYEGSYTTAHDARGMLSDPSWHRLFDLLQRARLAPDPWPFAGGATRIEAYAAGTPTAHMGIRTDPESWGRPQHMTTFDHIALEVPCVTAFSVGDYLSICRRVLHDGEFADAVAAEQAEVAFRLTDATRFWQQLLESYARWLTDRSA